MNENSSEQQAAKSGGQSSEDTDEDQYEDCRWLDELPSQGPVTLTPLDKLLWESLLGDSHQCSGHTQNSNNHAGWMVSEKANPQLAAVADQTRPTTGSTLPGSSTPVADSSLSRFRFQTSPITRPAHLPGDSPLVQASTICHDMLRTSTLPPAMSHAAPVANFTVEATQNKWDPDTIFGNKAPPKRAECKSKESALHTSKPKERTGKLRQTQTSAAAFRRLGVSGIEVMLSSVATIDDSIGSTADGSISTKEVSDQLTNSAASKTPQSARSDEHTDSDNNYDLQSCCRGCSRIKSFPSNAAVSNTQQQSLQSMDCTRTAHSLPLMSTSRQPWQLTTSRRRLFVGQNAPAPSNYWPQAPVYCPPPLWKSATSNADGRSAPAVSTEVTMEFSGESSDEAEFTPSSRVRQQQLHRLPIRVKPATKRPGFLAATHGSTTTATPFHSAHPHNTGGPVSLARSQLQLGRRFPATAERSPTSPTTFAKSSYSGSMRSVADDKFQLATTIINSKTASTNTEQSESTLYPSNGQDARPSLGRGILQSNFCSAMESGISDTSLLHIGVNEAVTDDSTAKSINPVSPQMCCAKTYEVLGFYGAPEPKEIPGMVTISRTRQPGSRSTTAASWTQQRECNSWNSTGCQTDACSKLDGGVRRNRRRRRRRAFLQRVSEHAMMDSSCGGGFAEWICVTGDQSGGSKSDGNSGSTATTYRSGGDQAKTQGWSPVQRLLLLPPCLPQTAQTTQRLHTAQALARREAGSGCAALPRTVDDGELGCAAALRLLPVDHARFVWLAARPPRYSRTCCQLLSGPLDNCQPSECGLALLRIPVFAHLPTSRGLALGSVDRQPVASSVRVAAPEIQTALRFVMPTEAPDAWSPSSCSESRNQQLPIAGSQVPALPWQQPLSRLIRQPEPVFIPTGAFFHTSCSSNSEPLMNSSPSLESAALANQQSSRRSTRSGSKAQQHRELRRVIRMRMQRKVHQDQFVDVPCCSQSTSEAEDSRSQGCQLGSLEQSLGGQLDSLRDSRQIAAVTAASLAGGSLSQQQSPGWRSNFSSVVQRILNESSSQQAAIKNLLAALQGDTAGDRCTGEHHDEERRSYQSSQSAATSIGSAASSPSEQFFSPATSGLTDVGSRASRRPAAKSLVESLKSDTNSRHQRSMSVNNNADNASVGTSLSTSGRGGRHQTFYARRCLIRLEESAALLVQETSCRDSSVVSVCSVHQDDSEENSSCTSAVQTAAITAQQRTQQRLLTLQRWTLAQAWQRPPLSNRFLDQMDPTVSSFIWWSLIPLHRRLRPPYLSSNSDTDPGLPPLTSSSPPFQPLSEMEVWHDSTSGSVSEDAGIGATTGQRKTIAV